jgi:hypothetical protein
MSFLLEKCAPEGSKLQSLNKQGGGDEQLGCHGVFVLRAEGGKYLRQYFIVVGPVLDDGPAVAGERVGCSPVWPWGIPRGGADRNDACRVYEWCRGKCSRIRLSVAVACRMGCCGGDG